MALLKQQIPRYEKKFLIPELSKIEVQALISTHPALFSEIYQERYINNIYFDTVNFNFYHANKSGVSNRIKVRLRWYGDLINESDRSSLEIKERKGDVILKRSYPVKGIRINQDQKISGILRKCLDKDMIGADLQIISLLRPVLVNRYLRRYYLSADKACRLTIDSLLSYNRIENQSSIFSTKKNGLDNIILELKYDIDFHSNINRITNHYPFRMTRNSKYVNGIDHLYCLEIA